MKFFAICAIVGAASAQMTPAEQKAVYAKEAAAKEAAQAKRDQMESPCDKTRNAYWNAESNADNMVRNCEQVGWKAYTPPAVQPGGYGPDTPWNACFPDRVEAFRKTQDSLRPAYRVCEIADDRRHLLENGIDVEQASSHHGDISASINWQHLENYSHQWADWFEGEAQSKEAQEIAMHLNSAAKKMVNTVAGRQAAVVRNAGRLVHAFTQYAEPGSDCNADAFAKCLDANVRQGMIDHRDVEDAFDGDCAHENNCRLMHGTQAQGDAGKKAMNATQQALGVMAHEVQQDVMGEMMSQKDNAEHVVKDFLAESNKQYKAWGCEPKCVDDATRALHRLHHIKHCHCPATVTISGDTSVIFQ